MATLTAKFKESPEYKAGGDGFKAGVSLLSNPFMERLKDEGTSMAPWLWTCGWVDAMKEKLEGLDNGS
jgi:hypothetical protein